MLSKGSVIGFVRHRARVGFWRRVLVGILRRIGDGTTTKKKANQERNDSHALVLKTNDE